MKKMFIVVAALVAMIGSTYANNAEKVCNSDSTLVSAFANLEDKNKEDMPHVVPFYDIDRLVIVNKKHVNIRVYDSHWNLVIDTDDSIDTKLTAGNYYVASNIKIKTKHIG